MCPYDWVMMTRFGRRIIITGNGIFEIIDGVDDYLSLHQPTTDSPRAMGIKTKARRVPSMLYPPALEWEDPRHPRHDARYNDLSREEMPATECLKDTLLRFLPCWHDLIAPAVLSGKRVVIAAHGNSLRALVKYLDGVSDADIVDLNIPTGIPLVYDLNGELKPIRHYYLGAAEDAMPGKATTNSL